MMRKLVSGRTHCYNDRIIRTGDGRMLVTVTGGSGSGKSAYAEQTAVRLAEGGRLLYLATMMRTAPEHRSESAGTGH